MSMVIKEEWRPIEGYENLYEVSNTGLVRNITKGKLLRPGFDKNGYLKCVLSKNGKARTAYIHRLVAYAFIKNPMYLPQVNHKDEDKTNNKVDNLEWCTPRYNVNYGSAQERRIQSMIQGGSSKTDAIKEYKRIHMMEYREKNKEKISEYKREYMKEYREKNKEKISEYGKKYREKMREKNKENNREYMKDYREKNKEKMREYWKEYYQKHKDKIMENNREYMKEYMREYRKKNKEKISEYMKKRYENRK